MDELTARYPDSERLKWNRDSDNFNVLNEADILISDFSGVLFDFSLVYNKPVIYTESEDFDNTPYDNSWLDEKMWSFQVLPLIGRKLTKDNFSNIGSLIDECINGSDRDSLAKGRDEARSQTWCSIGRGAKNTADYLIRKQEELTKDN